MNYLSTDKSFSMLSLTDLLAARDLYHVHLMHKENVVATALGRYLIRSRDPWPKDFSEFANQGKRKTDRPKPPRTLGNSEVRPYSWPCILVFVDRWVDDKEFGSGKGQVNPSDRVEKAIYMPDGKVVPICVVQAVKQPPPTDPALVDEMIFPDFLIGGGFPVIADVQKQERVASIGCLVSDGHDVYALTNRHVVGEPNEVVYSRLGGEKVRIGVSSSRQLTRKPFEEVYGQWPGKEAYLNLDVGLIKVDNLNCWTAKVFGIGQMGKLADLSIHNISLRLIGCPVLAFGCGSGEIKGAIHGLFYRYKSVGGFDYIADFLIGARTDKPFSTRRGDSGTVWMLDTDDADAGPMPMAVQWGGHVFLDQSARSMLSFALATCLSTVCRLLEVDVIRDWNIDDVNYWGEMGHYTVGAKTCGILSQKGLRKLMEDNADRVGFPDSSLKDPSKYQMGVAHYPFVPLADVADNVWRDSRPSDGNNHFADMDEEAGPGSLEGRTLMQLYDADPKSVNRDTWVKFYESHGPKTRHGALPFRVWEIYSEMVRFLNHGTNPDVESFVCAAGCLAHYIGDACQPLHVSRFHHGFPPVKAHSVAYDVHSIYETTMLNTFPGKIVDGVNAILKNVRVKPKFKTGQHAAWRTIDLMKQTIALIPPADLVTTYNKGANVNERVQRMWHDFGPQTIQSIANGAICLGEIWESAWEEGGGANIPLTKLNPIIPKRLSAIYNKPSFLLSRALRDMILT